ncbi:glycosyltransferase family 2 protein [Oleisolibacter albus]|uniref:glycosyltransferase family 2 protein n=1 Tax=Oleisolibacter albus TaxID=2171757 RepID=UPI00138FCC69|nr:glycosyltransferase [Oleisolibacter albus]
MSDLAGPCAAGAPTPDAAGAPTGAATGNLPQIDVVVLCWDRLDDTIETLDSVLAQRQVDVRVYVVDQGSKPETLAGMRAYRDAHADRVVYHEVGHNTGVPGGRNIGTRLGHAPLVVALDNDAVLPDALALRRAADLFAADPGLGALAFRVVNYFTGAFDRRTWVSKRSIERDERVAHAVPRFNGTGHAYRRDAFDRAGGYDDGLFFCWEELDLCLRIVNLGYEIRYTPDVTVRHKVAPEARVNWGGERFYYLVRNRLYVTYKYNRRPEQVLLYAAGYIAKGLYNGILPQTLRGIGDGVRLCLGLSRRPRDPNTRLAAATRSYFRTTDLAHRGSLLTRVRTEIFTRLS